MQKMDSSYYRVSCHTLKLSDDPHSGELISYSCRSPETNNNLSRH